MDEDEILHWLLSQIEKDEIEDITEDMLDKLVKEGRTMAVLFCKFPFFFLQKLINNKTIKNF